MQSRLPPTPQAYAELQTAYGHFNRTLFGGGLPDCLITLQRRKGTMGYFTPHRFVSADGRLVHEIAMNPQYFAAGPLEDNLSSLAHEMVHLRQFESGKPGRRGYHNVEWAEWMIELGMYPSSTGQPGGKKTGESVSHYLVENGPFIMSCRALLSTDFTLTWYDRFLPAVRGKDKSAVPQEQAGADAGVVAPTHLTPPPAPVQEAVEPHVAPNRSNRAKYACPGCGAQVWGKPGLSIACTRCQRNLAPT